MKQADYRSPEFYNILSTINNVLDSYGISKITENQGRILQSKYNVGAYNNKYIWRITNNEKAELLNIQLMFDIRATLQKYFPQYIASKIITIGNPKYTTNTLNQPIASIVIMITELPDNIITKDELLHFERGDKDVIKKCLEIESRMFKRDDDTRDAMTRVEDFAFSLIYEPLLTKANLAGISNLELKHQTDVVTLETDDQTDYVGEVNGIKVNIEGKSTKAAIRYDKDFNSDFASYIKDRLKNGSLGSIHGADSVLLVLKQTGDVICFNTMNTEENWLAGKIEL